MRGIQQALDKCSRCSVLGEEAGAPGPSSGLTGRQWPQLRFYVCGASKMLVRVGPSRRGQRQPCGPRTGQNSTVRRRSHLRDKLGGAVLAPATQTERKGIAARPRGRPGQAPRVNSFTSP